jgi:eukaryotic-like serine/threonine-protein kinase
MRDGPLPVEQALDIARQVWAGLAALHAKGIVHRDVKPENIHVTASGQVKILDFGIALLPSARRLTWAGLSAVLGTPDYMAPEQIRGRRGDARTDVYAAGTLLYGMLTGNLPFEAPNPAAVMRAKMDAAPTPPSRHARGLAPTIDAIIMRAIERDPRDRQASAAELLEDLASPFEPRRRAVTERGGRASPWRPARVVGVGVSVAAILVGIGALL